MAVQWRDVLEEEETRAIIYIREVGLLGAVTGIPRDVYGVYRRTPKGGRSDTMKMCRAEGVGDAVSSERRRRGGRGRRRRTNLLYYRDFTPSFLSGSWNGYLRAPSLWILPARSQGSEAIKPCLHAYDVGNQTCSGLWRQHLIRRVALVCCHHTRFRCAFVVRIRPGRACRRWPMTETLLGRGC